MFRYLIYFSEFFSDLLIIRYKTCLSIHTSYSVLMLNENKKIAMMPLC